MLSSAASTWAWWGLLDKFEFGENLFSRSAANKLALSILKVAQELS